ncbi:MAG TPA: thioredoxin family protein [Chitinophagaceae bacterium]|nr:thioredoxin family protein [Chitinophagaceae bacterium]
MRRIFFLFFIIAFVSCSSLHKLSRINYSIVPDDRAKILKGIINRSIIENDTSFAWFKENMKWGQVDEAAVDAFKQHANQFKLIVFGGTWCEDTQNVLPKFYRLIDKSNYPEKNIALIGVDRKKQTINNLSKKYNITNVPTIIVVSKGKEIGRVVEYGKSGSVEKDLIEIVQTIK